MSALAKIKLGIFLFVIGTLMVAFAPLAHSAPFVACDVDARTTHTAIQFCTTINTTATPATCTTWGTWSADTPVVGTTTKECRHDVATVATGLSLVRVKAIDTNSAWTGGREESAPSAPFAFTRPASLTSPGATRLVP